MSHGLWVSAYPSSEGCAKFSLEFFLGCTSNRMICLPMCFYIILLTNINILFIYNISELESYRIIVSVVSKWAISLTGLRTDVWHFHVLPHRDWDGTPCPLSQPVTSFWHRSSQWVAGTWSEDRTHDLFTKSRALYRLSYRAFLVSFKSYPSGFMDLSLVP